MYKKKDRQTGIYKRKTSLTTLKYLVFKIIKKCRIVIKSILIYCKLKIRYGTSVRLTPINSIKGNLQIELVSHATLRIGNFLMSAGPLYIKCVNDGKVEIGNHVFLNHNCSITCMEKIVIGDGCNIANNVVFVDHNHKLGKNGLEDGYEIEKIQVGKNVWIGANVTILKGVDIGDGAVIAAGAVVKNNIPSYEIWGGVPAKKLRSLKNE